MGFRLPAQPGVGAPSFGAVQRYAKALDVGGPVAAGDLRIAAVHRGKAADNGLPVGLQPVLAF